MKTKRKILYAPWRLKYLEGSKLSGCFVCEALSLADKPENLVVVKTERAGIILNRFPYNNGHLLIVPIKHVSSFTLLDQPTLAELSFWMQSTEFVLTQVYKSDGFNFGVNLGTAAGAGLACHLHIHVLPRWLGDTNFLTTCGDTRVIPEDLLATQKRLAPLFESIKASLPK